MQNFQDSMIFLGGYLETLQSRAQEKKWQATRHQNDAAETAKLFNDLKSIGIYLKIFKTYRTQREALIRCRDWVMKKATGDKGRLFVAVYKRFLT